MITVGRKVIIGTEWLRQMARTKKTAQKSTGGKGNNKVSLMKENLPTKESGRQETTNRAHATTSISSLNQSTAH